MAIFRFSRLGEADLQNIALYTLHTWGKSQALRYLSGLKTCCQTLADNAALGRPCNHIRPGLRCMVQGKHVIFYRWERGGILISRILHQRMLPEKHAMDDEDEEP